MFVLCALCKCSNLFLSVRRPIYNNSSSTIKGRKKRKKQKNEEKKGRNLSQREK